MDSGPRMRRRGRAQALDISEMSLTKTSYLSPELTYPLVIEPAVDGVDLEDWARDNAEYLDKELLKVGPTPALPEVPTAEPASAKKVTPSKKKEEDDEMAELAAWAS